MTTTLIKLIYDNLDYLNDVPEVVRAFRPYLDTDINSNDFISISTEYIDNNYNVTIASNLSETISQNYFIDNTFDNMIFKRISKRHIKTLLYEFCAKITHINLPYGSLTGVRPTKIYYDALGIQKDTKGFLIENYFVSESRAKLIENVVINQRGYISYQEDEVDIFVNIPFCPTRCKYCSFISTEISRVKKVIPQYIDNVIREIADIKQIVWDKKLKVRSIYIGGGTPTSLDANYLGMILNKLKDFNVEFTVEAGRPDSITLEKLKIMATNNVTRISINPQTFNDNTLELIGRKHTTSELLSAYQYARQFNFDINMDLIVGLEQETEEDMVDSLLKTIALSPENITIHTLSIKRGAVLKNDGAHLEEHGKILKIVDKIYAILYDNGYIPYYMYRQKNMADGLENVGFCKPNKQCKYNIDIMEETHSIIGAGAGAMSKRVYHKINKLERINNPKGTNEYLDRIETILDNKIAFFTNTTIE